MRSMQRWPASGACSRRRSEMYGGRSSLLRMRGSTANECFRMVLEEVGEETHGSRRFPDLLDHPRQTALHVRIGAIAARAQRVARALDRGLELAGNRRKMLKR